MRKKMKNVWQYIASKETAKELSSSN